MSEEDAAVAPSDELMALARERQFEALEAAWMRRIESGVSDPAELFSVAEYLVRKKFDEQAALLLWSLVAAAVERQSPRDALGVAVRAATIAPGATALREEIAGLYRRAAPDVPELPHVLDACEVLTAPEVKDAVRCIEHCLRLRPGTFVVHARSRRIGRVVGFQDGQFTIESERQSQSLSVRDTIANWEAVEPDDFRALIAFDPARLRALAAEDPVRLMQLLLRAVNGRAEFKQVKFMLIPAVIPADGWSAWWNRVKVLLKRSPTLAISEGTQPTFELRAGATDYAGQFRADFAALADPFEKVRRVMAYLDEVEAGHEGDAALAADLAADLFQIGQTAAEPAAALCALAAVAELRQRFDSVPDPREALTARASAVTDAARLLADIPAEETARMALLWIRNVLPERWPEVYAQGFAGASLRLCDFIARELSRAGRDDLLRDAIRRSALAPEQSGEAFGWSWRWALSGNTAQPPATAAGGSPAQPGAAEPPDEALDPVSVTVTLFDLMHRLARAPKRLDKEKRADSRQMAARLRNLVAAGDLRLMRSLIARVGVAEARRLHDATLANEGLGELRQEILAILRERHPEQFVEKKPLWEDEHIYTTAEGLRRRQDEFHKLTTEDIPRNAQAIGKAAALGDLRENWEYKSALEERDRLVERATRMKAELDRARVIPAGLPTEAVNVGMTVRLRETKTRAERAVSFVGPWDADIARGLYSYQAPLSQRFMGKRAGDKVRATFDDVEGEYEIVSISEFQAGAPG